MHARTCKQLLWAILAMLALAASAQAQSRASSYSPSGPRGSVVGMGTSGRYGSRPTVRATNATPDYFMYGLSGAETLQPVLPWQPQPAVSPYLFLGQPFSSGGLNTLNFLTLTRPALAQRSINRRREVESSLLSQRAAAARTARTVYGGPEALRRSASFMNQSHYFQPR